jgi:hypothetical protein
LESEASGGLEELPVPLAPPFVGDAALASSRMKVCSAAFGHIEQPDRSGGERHHADEDSPVVLIGAREQSRARRPFT